MVTTGWIGSEEPEERARELPFTDVLAAHRGAG